MVKDGYDLILNQDIQQRLVLGKIEFFFKETEFSYDLGFYWGAKDTSQRLKNNGADEI